MNSSPERIVTTSDVKKKAADIVWHIRQAAVILQHALPAWGWIQLAEQTEPREVIDERRKCLNIIGRLGSRLTRFTEVANGNEEVDPYAIIQNLIDLCDESLATELHVSTKDALEELGRRQAEQREKHPPEDNPQSGKLPRPNDAN